MPDPLPSRAEVISNMAETRRYRAVYARTAADCSLRWGIRYEAVIMVEVCNETLADFEGLLRLLPEA